ncbi:uncharacterized protein LOC118481071 [Helianthus annuus]|uniref:uncharacterized protein LOC118481071 n=1 Tax=Helianthus annuus TaxID=4232 RepID=UPI00165304A1|nr:uncharacterized protein LOC118481071 [Helianthus annuus]
MDRLPTAEALKKRNVIINPSFCKFCESSEETAEHIFIGCQSAAVIWNIVSSWCKIPGIFAFSVKDLFTIFRDLRVSEKKRDAVQGIVMITCWCIWRARNKARFSDSTFKIENIVSEVKALGFLWFSRRSKYKDLVWDDWCSFVNI